jgi:hypothetical protein
MKILLDKEYELKLTSLAVETIEEHYDKAIEEIFQGNLKAKDINFIVWAGMADAPDLDTTKKLFAEKYTYKQMIQLMNDLLGDDPNGQRADTDNE